LSGIYLKDSGEVFVDGKAVEIGNALESRALGISVIHQELNLLRNMDIAENLFIGREQKKYGFVDKPRMHREAAVLLAKVGLDIDTRTRVGTLSTAQKQMVEVAKALSLNANLIIMDEPTSSLTETETATLFRIIGELKRNGVSIVFITHRMKEIFEISDSITIMRDGRTVADLVTRETDEREVIGHMIGRELKDIFAKGEAEIGECVLEVRNLGTKDFLRDISFKVRRGEILGFAGLVGAGRSEVMRAVFGVDKRESGEILIDGNKVRIESTVDAIRCGIGFVPEDRKEQALILKMSVKKNLSLAALDKCATNNFISDSRENGIVDGFVKALQIRTPSTDQRVLNLSGGNQQKVVIGKWLAIKPKILILDEPTRGIDVGTKKDIHMLMSQLAREGVAIIMISSELPEVLGMSDRIVVLHEGRMKGELSRSEASQEAVMNMAISGQAGRRS
jgi:ABC-type sugar transport system ATPase subunit